MKQLTKTSLVALFVILAATFSSVYAQSSCCGGEHGSMAKMEKSAVGKDTTKSKIKSSIVRTGIIDVKAIDKNKDGKVFQDMMDWNVISDKPGKCPLCKMVLKEVTIKEAEANLVKNGFKIKK
jgi:hypothetical protein